MIKLKDILNESFNANEYSKAKRAIQKVVGSGYVLKLYNELDPDRDWSNPKRLARENAKEVGIYVRTPGSRGELYGYGKFDMESRVWNVSLDDGSHFKGRF